MTDIVSPSTAERFAETLNIKRRQANALADRFDSVEEMIDYLRNANSLGDVDGVGDQTRLAVDSWLESNHPEVVRERKENNEGIATEFGTAGEMTEEGDLIWWFVCPRCASEQDCYGDPAAFANRPYRCNNCNWVAALDAESIQQFKRGIDT